MITSDTFTQDMLSNPSKLTKATIDAMEQSDTGTGFTIQDPNNGFVMQLMANMSVFAKFSEKIDNTYSFMYPQRSRTAEQLYPHLSEFDYIKLMASPATLPFVFAMDRDWISANSIYFDENYDKIEIPSTSFFTMGGVTYSMYHGIDILVNRNTGAVTAFYNSDTKTYLNVLESNMLLDVQEFTRDGINWFQIMFNMYQFERNQEIFTVGSEQGFIKTLSYEDQFYAIKVSTLRSDGVWEELQYSLTQMFYDYQSPTAILSLLTDQSSVKIEIPQIYFDNGQISQKIKVETFSTKGAVNYSLSPADVTGIKANFDTSSTPFAAPLTQMPTWIISPAVVEVAGGSNVMSYEEMREAVVKQRLYDRVAVTTPEIIEAGKKAGFDLTRITDDLTERMYIATNVLVDSNDMVIPTFAGSILIADKSLKNDPSTIINFSDGYYTILPTTTFKIAQNGLTCVPMSDGEVATMGQMTNKQMVDELNKGTYVRQPFHITLLTNPKSPQALIYNLLSPSMTSLTFIKENPHSAPQMAVTACKVNHLDNGTGGYQVVMGVTRSSNIVDEDSSSFNVFMTCRSKTGEPVYLPAVYRGVDEYGIDNWEVKLATLYHITTDDFITVMMYDGNDILSEVEISLNQSFTIVTSFDRNFDTGIRVDSVLNGHLPSSRMNTDVAMAQQTMVLSLGRNLSSQIYCGVNTNWGNDVYKTADETVYYKTNVPVFQTTEAGIINTRYNATSKATEIVVLYPADATPADTRDLAITVTKTIATATSSTTTKFNVGDTTGVLVGMQVRGLNIPVGAVVKSFTKQTLTISVPIETPVTINTVLTLTNPHALLRTSAAQGAAGDQLTVASTANLLVGQSVFGFDLAAGTLVKSIESNTQFTLSKPTLKALTSDSLLTIVNTTAPGVVKIQKGDVISDPTGKPIVIKGAENQYMIPAILFDGRLFASQDPKDQQIITTISQRLQNYANQIATIDAGLIEDSNVFYKPARTMGYANFGIGSGRTINIPLELSFEVTVYVDISVFNTQTLLSTMSASILSEVNAGIQRPVISVSEITDDIRRTLGTNVSAVEMGDISGIDDLRLISLEERGATPSIENFLSIQSDNSIKRSPNVKITYLPKPDTSEASILARI